MSNRRTLTSDIGFAIRDYLEGNAISHIDGVTEYGGADAIATVDISDANNPVLFMESGAQFTIRIVRTG